MREDPLMDMDLHGPGVAELVADVAAAVAAAGGVGGRLPGDSPGDPAAGGGQAAAGPARVPASTPTSRRACRSCSTRSTCRGPGPGRGVEYARRLAQRGTPLTTLLRTYRLGHARFSDWLLKELARHAGDAERDQRDHPQHVQDRRCLHRPDLRGDGRRLHAGAGTLAAESERGQGGQGPRAAGR